MQTQMREILQSLDTLVYVTSSTTGSLPETYGALETSIILNNLEPNTTYEFSVAAVREGKGGTGPPSPLAYATTLSPGKEL